MATLATADAADRASDRNAVFDLGPGAHECWYPVALSNTNNCGRASGNSFLTSFAALLWTEWLHRASTFPSLTQSRSEEHTSELQSLMRISYAVFCLKKK